MAPFTPDDALFGEFWPQRGRVTSVPCELTRFIPYAWLAPYQTWDDWDGLSATFDCGDATEPKNWWEPIPRSLGTWRVVHLEG